jgi:MFS family permease
MTTQLLEPVLQQTTSHTAVFDSSQHNTDPINNHAPLTPVATNTKATMRTWRFWAIIVSLMVTGLVSALEGTIITSALPTITEALGGGNAYIWVPNAYLLASVAVLPLFAQASNIFGRRILLLGAVAIFTLGSGLCGGASSMSMLIVARTIQGFGGGGINLLIETVVTDLVPLRERGKYMSIVYLGATVGATIGPFLGGVITDRSTWRWCFYLNVPIGGGTRPYPTFRSETMLIFTVAFACLFVFLNVNYQREAGWKKQFARIDVVGNLIFVGAIVACLIALTWGGTVYKWDTFHIVVPLILGFFGLFLWTAFEWTPKLCKEPSFPRKIVSNRTSAAALGLTFIHAIVTYWTYYFLPIYFQAVKGQSPMNSGIDTLPTFAGGLLCALVGGILLSKIGRYKPLHFAASIPMIIAFGLFSIMNANTHPAAWAWFQLICAAGSGLMSGILLPAVQAPLDETYVATSTGLWSFARYFGCIWGVAIPSAIFNNECSRLARGLGDVDIAELLTGGRAYQYATAAFVNSIEDATTRTEVVEVFAGALRVVWLIGIAFAGIGFLLVFVEKEIELRNELNTEFGMEERKKNDDLPAQSEGGTELAECSSH